MLVTVKLVLCCPKLGMMAVSMSLPIPADYLLNQGADTVLHAMSC